MAKTKRRIAAENINGIIRETAAEDVDKLEIKCEEISVNFETGLFPGGDELRHMCVIILEQKFCNKSGNPTFVYTVL